MIETMEAALEYIFRTRRRLDAAPRGLDEHTRDPASTRRLLERADLPLAIREYVVVTGSRGKGSVVCITAKLLQALGHRVGTITSPHLVYWNERIRVNGRMIPEEDFLRILSELQIHIDAITAELDGLEYLSPQGIFLAIALQYFDEAGVNVAVLEVGRGGRFDDIAVVPHRLALFAPIMLEHRSLLGNTLERIAWHKAGIISHGGIALSTSQALAVAEVLQREAESKQATLRTFDEREQARWLSNDREGQMIHLEPYGELLLPMMGRYQIENASLAIRAVETLHQIWSTKSAIDEATIDAIRRGLSQAAWPGRVQKLADSPAVYLDGAITARSAQLFIDSVEPHFREPVVAIVGIPQDRDYAAVYQVMARVTQTLIITETDINPNTRFPDRQAALQVAKPLVETAHFAPNLTEALSQARAITGERGTILLAVSLMLVGECMLIWNIDTSQI